jgi:uridylate kinase
LRAVVKLGGGLFKRDPDTSTIKHFAVSLSRFVSDNNHLVLVAGGGENARTYINAARKLGAEESTCDLLGIQITRANAELLRVAFENETGALTTKRLSRLPDLVRTNRIVVMGGLQPGQSTNAVAALAAEITRAEILVNATDVDGVYTEDPKKNPKAKLLKTIHVGKLLELAMRGKVFAGRYELLDPLAVKILERSKTPTRFVSLSNPENVLDAIMGKDVGTLVVYD